MLSYNNMQKSTAMFGLKPGAGKSVGRRMGKWECCLSERLIGEYLLVPLTTTKMLKSEGYLMNNCCREFASQCERMSYSLFSIRSRSGERLATLGLAKVQGSWQVDQCFGPSHSEVLEERFNFLDEEEVLQTEYYPTEIYYVAHEVVRLMNSIVNGH